MTVTAEIEEIQTVRDILATVWAPWARKKTGPNGYPEETIEYSLMRFGAQAPKTQGAPRIDSNPKAEEVEAILMSMPSHLRKFIVAEFIVRGAPAKRAQATHSSVPQYYKELRSAFWWLAGNGRIYSLI